MVDGVPASETDTSGGEIVESLGGTPSFHVEAPEYDPLRPTPIERPANIPEKFWDPQKGAVRMDDLLKSYTELESQFGKAKAADPADPTDPVDPLAVDPVDPADPADPADPDPADPADPDPADPADPADPEDPAPKPEEVFQSALTDAQAVYQETGTLDEAARKPLLDLGVPNEYIDYHLKAVKAEEEALRSKAAEAAGGDYATVEKAIAWAAENWPEKRSIAFNAQVGSLDTVDVAVAALIKDYHAANPGEGKLTNITSGTNFGDVYTSMEQFGEDLKKADEKSSRADRRAAVEKLQRSQKAKTIK